MDRTIRLVLEPDAEQFKALNETLKQFTEVYNAVCRYAWENKERNGVSLHRATYYPLRAEYPQLPSNVLIQARVRATETLRASTGRERRGMKTSMPYSAQCPVRFEKSHTIKIEWAARLAILSLIGGKVGISFKAPRHFDKYLGGQVCIGELIRYKNHFALHVVIELPEPEFQPSGEVIGIDLGVARPAVTSQNRFLGLRRWRELEARYFRLRRRLQAKGTKSAKKHLRRLSGKQFRLRRDLDHQLSRQITNSVSPGAIIVVENLTDIRNYAKGRKKERRRIHNWSFRRLRFYLSYKAQENGMLVAGIDPRNTSRTCPSCGSIDRLNRRSQSEFDCRDCHYQLNADLVAARNIRAKYIAGSGISASGGPLSTGLSSQSQD